MNIEWKKLDPPKKSKTKFQYYSTKSEKFDFLNMVEVAFFLLFFFYFNRVFCYYYLIRFSIRLDIYFLLFYYPWEILFWQIAKSGYTPLWLRCYNNVYTMFRKHEYQKVNFLRVMCYTSFFCLMQSIILAIFL